MDTSRMMKESVELFGSELYCAESVLAVILKYQGLDSSISPGVASAFCSGMCRCDGMCGALSGGLMAIGAVVAGQDPKSHREVVYELGSELVRWFRESFEADKCFELIGCDISTAQGRQYFRDNAVKANRCNMFVARTTARTAELLAVVAKD